jgi:hypothetical protein
MIFLWIIWITYGRDECVTDSQCWEWMRCSGWSCIVSITEPNTPSDNPNGWNTNQTTENPTTGWNTNQTTETPTVECSEKNCDWICQDNVCIRNDYWDLWIYVTTGCLLNGQCSMNIYDTIGIRQKDPNPDVKTFAQDIVLWATMFFGTVMTVLIIVSWLSYVMAWFSGKSPDKAKKMLIWSIVWLLFVTLSYTIIRLIQFLATWWS